MPRYRLLVEYDGRPYHGFQAQADQPSVQGSIERAIRAFCGQTLRLHAAGRTDSGVHAIGQVIHIDLE
ncbi:MAG TPA: tRNA pseudouridine(38-40) synthase TruA, partial [Caulobacteraceae bacterium]